jgi:hypothetical protein
VVLPAPGVCVLGVGGVKEWTDVGQRVSDSQEE